MKKKSSYGFFGVFFLQSFDLSGQILAIAMDIFSKGRSFFIHFSIEKFLDGAIAKKNNA